MTTRVIFIAAATAALTSAGELNVVCLGADAGFQISAGGTHTEFALPRGAASGRFRTPDDKPARISTTSTPKASVEIPATTASHIAIFRDSHDGGVWTTHASKPSEGAFSLRVVNLADTKAVVKNGKKELTIEPGKEASPEHADNEITLPGGARSTAPKTEVPCAMIAFVYRDGDTWKVHFLADN